jgi:hypothetical protein
MRRVYGVFGDFNSREKMMKKLITLLIMVVLVFSATSVHAWLIYSKPEFRGRIIDAETKEPIEGVVVVVVYYDHTIVGGPGGGGTSVIKAKETLTDKKGEFYFPSYITLIGPNSREDNAEFIIFKPGYMSDSSPSGGSRVIDEKFFAITTDIIGKEGVLLDNTFPNAKPWKGVLGIVELERAKTREDRRKTRPSSGGLSANQLPIFFKILEEEYHHLYN